MKTAARKSKAGMTLVEILLALLILAIAAGVLMTATSQCLNVVGTAKNYYEARRILELAELDYPVLVIQNPGDKEPRPINLDIGPIEFPRNFNFQRSAERDNEKKDLMVIKNRVTWSVRGKSAFEEVTTYLYYTNDVAF